MIFLSHTIIDLKINHVKFYYYIVQYKYAGVIIYKVVLLYIYIYIYFFFFC